MLENLTYTPFFYSISASIVIFLLFMGVTQSGWFAGRFGKGSVREVLVKRLYVEDVLEELEGITSVRTPSSSEEAAAPELNRLEQRLYDALGPEPMHIDDLCVQTDVDASSALVYLLSLEFKGLVRQLAGRQFFRVQ